MIRSLRHKCLRRLFLRGDARDVDLVDYHRGHGRV